LSISRPIGRIVPAVARCDDDPVLVMAGAVIFLGAADEGVLIAAEYGGGGASEASSTRIFADLFLRWEDDPGTVKVDVTLLAVELSLRRVPDV